MNEDCGVGLAILNGWLGELQWLNIGEVRLERQYAVNVWIPYDRTQVYNYVRTVQINE